MSSPSGGANDICAGASDCLSGRCACSDFGLRGHCAPVAAGFRCDRDEDCDEARGEVCVRFPGVDGLFSMAYCGGTCQPATMSTR